MATTIDPSSFPQPVFDLAYLYAQPSNSSEGPSEIGQETAPLDGQGPLPSPPKEHTTADPRENPKKRRRSNGYGAQGHGAIGTAQESGSMAASEPNAGSSSVADAALVSNRPKRVRTGMWIYSGSGFSLVHSCSD